ncbi:MAG: type VII secretion-associated protein [Mycobacterium sp.]
MAENLGRIVIEVGPETVRVLDGDAGRTVSESLIRAGLDWIDDPVGLLDDTPVPVADLWRDILAAALGPSCGAATLVHPDDWPSTRVAVVVAAAHSVAERVTAIRQTDWMPEEPCDRPRRGGRRLTVIAAVFGLGLVVAMLSALIQYAPGLFGPSLDSSAGTGRLIAEGRIEVRVPPDWTLERITGGPGSRRIKVWAPERPDVALHITQAYAPETTQDQTAESLRRAIADQPAGIFVDFHRDEQVAGRAAVTYREIRPGRDIRWAVLPVGSTRISIGCQSPPGRQDAVRVACEDAVHSARESGRVS